MRLKDESQAPEIGAKCVVKGYLTPFAATYKNLEFTAETIVNVNDEELAQPEE